MRLYLQFIITSQSYIGKIFLLKLASECIGGILRKFLTHEVETVHPVEVKHRTESYIYRYLYLVIRDQTIEEENIYVRISSLICVLGQFN